MKVLVTGANGQLGHDVVNELRKRNYDVITSDITGDVDYLLDVTDESVINKIIELKPDAIINCVAWTAVDAAEDEENKDKVYALNVKGVSNMVDAAVKLDCKFLHLSTDYVFNGQGVTPWKPDDKTYDPLSYYGQTKLEGEFEVNRLDKFFLLLELLGCLVNMVLILLRQ